MPLDEFMFLLTAGTTIIAIGLLVAAAVLTNKYGNKVLITPVAFIVIMIAVGVFVCLKVNNGKMMVEAEFYDSVSSSFFEDGRYHTVTIDCENKNIKRTAWYGSQTINVTVKDQESNTKSSIVRTRRIWGALYDEEIELQVSQDEYDNQIFKKQNMVSIKVLKNSIVISGKSFDECKAEFDRVCNGIKKDFSVEWLTTDLCRM